MQAAASTSDSQAVSLLQSRTLFLRVVLLRLGIQPVNMMSLYTTATRPAGHADHAASSFGVVLDLLVFVKCGLVRAHDAHFLRVVCFS